MKRAGMLLMSLVALCATGTTQVDKVQEPKGVTSRPMAPDAEIKALLAECDANKKNYSVKFAEFKPRFEAFAKKHRGSEAGLEAELWLFSGCWWSRKDGSMNEKAEVVARRIVENYKDSKNLGKMMDLVYVFSPTQKEEWANRVLKLSGNAEVQAAVHLALGKLHYRSKNETKRREGREHLLLLAKKYKDISYRNTTFGRMADAFLHPHDPKGLAVGQVAPEILGTGIDGKPMKLSDYRGNIVVLDFWGDW